jgi:uncharacterized protein (DUF924 family)
MALESHQSVLDFWFHEIDPKLWFTSDSGFDALIGARFKRCLAQAVAGELYGWRRSPEGRLAEVIVLDQFPRNLHRGTPAAFTHDAMALVLAQEAVAGGALGALEPVQCSFLLLPYMHSESRSIHVVAEALYREHAPPLNHDFELRHKVIIDRFGRYPHRNAILGRPSTPEELEFLAQPGSGF